MKSFFIFCFLFVCFWSCKKDDDTSERYWGTVSAIKNGTEWGGEIFSTSNYYGAGEGINIFVNTFSAEGYERETLTFVKVPEVVTKYPISETSGLAKDSLIGSIYLTLLSDGDVIGDIYSLLSDDPIEDYIEITEISGKEIRGVFQVSFVKDTIYPESDPSAPDTVIFTGGVFHTKILDR